MTDQEYMSFDLNKLDEYDLTYFKLLSFKTLACLINKDSKTQWAWKKEDRPLFEVGSHTISEENKEFFIRYEKECKKLCRDYENDLLVDSEPYTMFDSVLVLYSFAGTSFSQLRDKEPIDFRQFMTEVYAKTKTDDENVILINIDDNIEFTLIIDDV